MGSWEWPTTRWILTAYCLLPTASFQRKRRCGGRRWPVDTGARVSLWRKLMRPLSRSYGVISTVTRSPARMRMRFFLHPSRRVGDDDVPVVELHAATRIGQHLVDDALEFQHLFLGHALSSLGGRCALVKARCLRRPLARAGRGHKKASDRDLQGRIWAGRADAASENWRRGQAVRRRDHATVIRARLIQPFSLHSSGR